MRLIVGLGNPGPQYAKTRHNAGFMVLDSLANGKPFEKHRRFQGEILAFSNDLLLVKPQTYMNGSGECVQAVMSFYKIPLTDLLVVVDDIQLALGDLRLRAEGSAGGHNGLKDIESRIGREYARLRLGVGSATSQALIDHVLGRFETTEEPDVQAMIAKAQQCVSAWIEGGVPLAQRYNGPLRPPPPRPKPVSLPTPTEDSGPVV